MKIENIIIGTRARKDMGDLEGLASSMKRHGLLHPVVVKKDGALVAGHRRIEAALLNGWTEIAVTVIEVEDLLSAERDENSERKDFSPTEAVEIGRLIEAQHLAKIAAVANSNRSLAGKASAAKRAGKPTGVVKNGVVAFGDTNDTAAAAVGMSATSYYKAKAVVAAAESDPKKFGDLAEQMNETGKVYAAHNEMKRRAGTNDKDGKKPRHPIFKKMHYPKPNQAVEKTTWALEGLCDALEKVNAAELDTQKISQWVESLKKSTARINQSCRRFLNG